MEKYKSNEKLKNKQSTFSMLRNFLKAAKETEDKLFKIYDELEKFEKGTLEYEKLDKEAVRLENKMKKFNESKAGLRKLFLKCGSIVVGGAVIITGAVSLIQNGIESNKNDLVLEALASKNPAIVEVYKNDSDKLKALTESPEKVTQLALDTLKAKLAKHYDANNIGDFTISRRTTRPDYAENEITDYYQIFYKGEEISAYIIESNYGDTSIIKDTMPKEVIDTIDAIAAAQSDPESSFKAYNALKKVTDEKTDKGIDSGLPTYLPSEQEIDR